MRIDWIFCGICNYFDFTTPLNSKCCSICYRLTVILGAYTVIWDRDLCQWKAIPRLPNTSLYKVLLYLSLFGRNSNVRYGIIGNSIMPPPYSTPVYGIWVDLGGRKLYQSKCRSPIPIRVLYTLCAYLAPLVTIQRRRRPTDIVRQTERAEQAAYVITWAA